jgi:hypothetical protein
MYHKTPSLDFRHHTPDVFVAHRHISCRTSEQLLKCIIIRQIVEQDNYIASIVRPGQVPFKSLHSGGPVVTRTHHAQRPEPYEVLISKVLIAGCLRIRSPSVEIDDRNSLANLLALDSPASPEGEGAHLVELFFHRREHCDRFTGNEIEASIPSENVKKAGVHRESSRLTAKPF